MLNNQPAVSFEISITGTGTVTIGKVPYGTYTISEVKHWRYDAWGSQEVKIDDEDNTGEVTFVNVLSNDKWLDGTAEPKANVASKKGGNS